MILRKFFSVSRNAPATQRNTIPGSRRRQTFPVRFLTPDCGDSMIFVVAKQRCRLGGTSARLIVNVSFNPSRKLAAACGWSRSILSAGFLIRPSPSSASGDRQAARISERHEDRLVSEMVIGFKMFRERFTSRVDLDRDALRIDVAYADGPFKHLTNQWIFEDHPRGCSIDFYVDFEFRSRLLQKLIEVLFHEAVRRMVGAFEVRARALYGPPSKI